MRVLHWSWLGRRPYGPTYALQERLREGVRAGRPEHLLLRRGAKDVLVATILVRSSRSGQRRGPKKMTRGGRLSHVAAADGKTA